MNNNKARYDSFDLLNELVLHDGELKKERVTRVLVRGFVNGT